MVRNPERLRTRSKTATRRQSQIATLVNGLGGNLQQHLLLSVKPTSTWQNVRGIVENYHSSTFVPNPTTGHIAYLAHGSPEDQVNYIKRHSGDTLGTPPRFSGTLRRTLPGTLRARRARTSPKPPVGGRGCLNNGPGLRRPGDSQRESGRFARINSRKSIRRKAPIFLYNLRAIRVNRLKPAIRNFSPPEERFAKKGFSSGTLKRFARIRRFARTCKSIRANRAKLDHL